MIETTTGASLWNVKALLAERELPTQQSLSMPNGLYIWLRALWLALLSQNATSFFRQSRAIAGPSTPGSCPTTKLADKRSRWVETLLQYKAALMHDFSEKPGFLGNSY